MPKKTSSKVAGILLVEMHKVFLRKILPCIRSINSWEMSILLFRQALQYQGNKLRQIGFWNWIVDNLYSKLSEFEQQNLSDTNKVSKIGFWLKDNVKILFKLYNVWFKNVKIWQCLIKIWSKDDFNVNYKFKKVKFNQKVKFNLLFWTFLIKHTTFLRPHFWFLILF